MPKRNTKNLKKKKKQKQLQQQQPQSLRCMCKKKTDIENEPNQKVLRFVVDVIYFCFANVCMFAFYFYQTKRIVT